MCVKSELIVSISKLISPVGDLPSTLLSISAFVSKSFLPFSPSSVYDWTSKKKRKERPSPTFSSPFPWRKEMSSHQFLAELLKEEPRCILMGGRGWTVEGRTLIPLEHFRFPDYWYLWWNFERHSKGIFLVPVGEKLLAKHTTEREWNIEIWICG